MRKTIISVFILIGILLIATTSYGALTVDLELTQDKDIIIQEDKVTVTFSLSNITSEQTKDGGVLGLETRLDYDSDIFTVSDDDIEVKVPSSDINAKIRNNLLIVELSTPVNSTEEVDLFEISFNVTGDKEDLGDTSISFNDILVYNVGEEFDLGDKTVEMRAIEKIDVTFDNPSEDDDPSDPTNDDYYKEEIEYDETTGEILKVYLREISPNTTEQEFLSKIQTNETAVIKLYDREGNEVTGKIGQDGYNKFISTEMKMIVTLTDETSQTVQTREFILVVKGDTNGDGHANGSDSLALLLYRAFNGYEEILTQEQIEDWILTGARFKAGDINRSNTITGQDSLILLLHRAYWVNPEEADKNLDYKL